MNRIGDNLQCFEPNKQIVEAFARHQVSYVLVGGLAVAWYCREREADDMDLLVEPTLENSRKIRDALAGLRMTVSVPETGFTTPGVQAQVKEYYYVDIITPPIDGPSFDKVSKDTVEAKLFNLPVRVPSVAMLIRLKELTVIAEAKNATAVQKHQRDIELLRALST